MSKEVLIAGAVLLALAQKSFGQDYTQTQNLHMTAEAVCEMKTEIVRTGLRLAKDGVLPSTTEAYYEIFGFGEEERGHLKNYVQLAIDYNVDNVILLEAYKRGCNAAMKQTLEELGH